MPVTATVTVAAAQADPTPADNTATHTVMRTVRSAPTDWVAEVPGLIKLGDNLLVQFRVTNRGPATVATAETMFTYTAPPGTEWTKDPGPTCVAIRPRVEYRCNSSGFNPPDVEPVTHFWTWQVTIVGPQVGEGSFRVEGLGGELKPADNVAKIVIDAGGPAPGSGTGGEAGGGGSLPITGAKVTGLAAGGVLVLVVGAALIWAGRRRRHTFVG